jgi:hypothetical protein
MMEEELLNVYKKAAFEVKKSPHYTLGFVPPLDTHLMQENCSFQTVPTVLQKNNSIYFPIISERCFCA